MLFSLTYQRGLVFRDISKWNIGLTLVDKGSVVLESLES